MDNNRPPLSKELLRDDLPDELVLAEPMTWYARRDIDVVLGTTVVALDAPRQTARLEDGRTIRFEHCLLATGAEPLRLGSQQGYQIFASAEDPSGGELSIVQWLRFGGSAYMQFVGISRTNEWRTAYPRFRSVRDGIEPR